MLSSWWVAALLAVNTVAAGWVLWSCLCSIAHMHPATDEAIRWPFVVKATGLFIQLVATADFFYGTPRTWPWLLLVGVLCANAGGTLIYLHNRRACRCPECPSRKTLREVKWHS